LLKRDKDQKDGFGCVSLPSTKNIRTDRPQTEWQHHRTILFIFIFPFTKTGRVFCFLVMSTLRYNRLLKYMVTRQSLDPSRNSHDPNDTGSIRLFDSVTSVRFRFGFGSVLVSLIVQGCKVSKSTPGCVSHIIDNLTTHH
jgi:hypothetical protein